MKFIKGIYIGMLVQMLSLLTTSAEEMVKCIKEENEKIQIGCPHGHVIYNPSIYAGVGVNQTCTKSPDDCVGMPRRLQRSVNKCFLKKSCNLTLSRDDSIMCGNKVDDSKRHITYVVFKKMFCIRKEYVNDVCNLKYYKNDDTQYTRIIRSHKYYPSRRPKSNGMCETEIPIARRSSLILDVTDTTDGHIPQGLHILSISRTTASKKVVDFRQMQVLHGNETKAMKVIADFRWKRRYLKGFMLSYSVYETKALDGYHMFPAGSRPALTELGRIFEVRPVIEQCAANTVGLMELTCKPDEVIYFPAMSVSGNNRRVPKCTFGKYVCGGMTAGLLVQENECYWKNRCSVQWDSMSKIVMSKEIKCIGQTASVLGSSGHRCVHKDSIYDMCAKNSAVIDAPWGIIRSHPNYPWAVGPACTEFKRQIKVGRKHVLTIAVQDIDLDADGKDKLSIYHLPRKGRKRKILDSKSVEGSTIHVTEGDVTITFKRSRNSKTGRGFILVFHRFLVSSRTLPSYSGTPIIHTKDIANDAAYGGIQRVSNWRKCSQRGKARQEARSCNRLVWTDYYKRIV